jgi:enterochelin esterase-like enzyme
MKLEPHIIFGREYSRDVWFCPGPTDRPHRLCIFLDGQHYHRDMDAVPLLETLLAEPGIPPLSLLFISHVGVGGGAADYSACRTADYTCNDRYAKFVAEDVVQWAQARNRGIRDRDHVICGLSLSGLESAHIALRHGEVFSAALSQAGSFWWLHGRELRLPPTTAKFWLSVGDEETATGIAHSPELFQAISQIDGVEQAARKFRQLGGNVHHHQYPGGHAPGPWRADLAPALRWLLTDGEPRSIAG